MSQELAPVSTLQPSILRAAASEALLAGALLLSDVARQVANYDPSTSQAKQGEERFRKALEALREALS